MAAFFMREMVWQLVGARTWRARQVYVMMPVADLHGRAPHVGAPTEKEAVLMRQPLFYFDKDKVLSMSGLYVSYFFFKASKSYWRYDG